MNNPLLYTDPTGYSWYDLPEGHLGKIIEHRNSDCDGSGGFYNGEDGYGGIEYFEKSNKKNNYIVTYTIFDDVVPDVSKEEVKEIINVIVQK